LPITAPKAAKTLKARLAYESACIQAVEEEYVVDGERVLIFTASGPLTMILIIWKTRIFVVFAGLGCIPMMKVELTAENRPA